MKRPWRLTRILAESARDEADRAALRSAELQPLTHYASSTDGLVADINPRIACGTLRWAIVSEHPHQVTCPDCRAELQQASADARPGRTCRDCGKREGSDACIRACGGAR